MSAERPADRGGLRDLDSHASWREVYYALDVDLKVDRDQEVRFDG